MNKYALFSNDVETHSIWHNTLRDETGLKIFHEGLPAIIDLYSKHNIRTTFFFVGDYAKKFPGIVKLVLKDGHEVASHGYTHEVSKAFDILPYDKQVAHLKKSKDILEDISGQEVISFRAPALRINNHTAFALAEAGFKIDSSVSSQRFDMFLSFGSRKKFRFLLAPRAPYRTKHDDLTRRGDGPIIEVPLSAMILPYVGATMRVFPMFFKIQRRFLHWESNLFNKPIVFYMHPSEFIDESKEKRKIQRRAENILSYLMGDIVRNLIKVRNLGPITLTLYENEIKFYLDKGYSFTTIKDYCVQKGLI